MIWPPACELVDTTRFFEVADAEVLEANMAQLARNAERSQEFWRPAVDETRNREAGRALTMHPEACDRCGTDFAMGARFCHLCGHQRTAEMGSTAGSRWNLFRFLDLERIKGAVGLPLASVIALFIGMACT